MPETNNNWTPLMKALVLNLAILAIWYMLEYAQFGELQWGRTGDDAVGLIYFLVTYLLLRKCDGYAKKGAGR